MPGKVVIVTSVDDIIDNSLDLNIYPNPISHSATLDFITEENEWVRISVVNNLGSELKTICNKRIQPGNHSIPIDLSGYPSGSYFVRFISGKKQKSVPLMKI